MINAEPEKGITTMLLKACLNGSRTPGEHPALPLTPQELAHDAQLVVAAGARALHIHPRSASGAQSLAARDIAAALTAVRAHCPAIPVGVSSTLWIEPDVQRRLQLIQGWTVQPDFVSVNFSEPGALELCTHFLSRGVGIEAGLWTVEDVQLFLTSGLADRCLRILIEPREQEVSSARATAEAIIHSLDTYHVQLPRLLHGSDDTVAWPILDFALQCGYDTRIGFEDTLTLPDGKKAKNNAELVSLAVAKARQVGKM
ncbi:MAG: 3-keto-5-aminohexanoate cleavage protein [Ktedonobacteraceae bacterium]